MSETLWAEPSASGAVQIWNHTQSLLSSAIIGVPAGFGRVSSFHQALRHAVSIRSCTISSHVAAASLAAG